MTDLEILKLIRANKLEKPIKELYAHFPAVHSTLLKHGAQKSITQEIFNDALVILIEKSRSVDFELTAKYSTYVTGIALNLLRNQLRKTGRIKEGIVLEDMLQAEDLSETDYNQEKEEKLEMLEKVLDAIQEKCKRILQLFYFEKQNMREIAESMGYSSSQSAKTQKFKCLEAAHKLANEMIVKSETTVL